LCSPSLSQNRPCIRSSHHPHNIPKIRCAIWVPTNSTFAFVHRMCSKTGFKVGSAGHGQRLINPRRSFAAAGGRITVGTPVGM
jgi:hypothetical protein